LCSRLNWVFGDQDQAGWSDFEEEDLIVGSGLQEATFTRLTGRA
jgi:hypothetical protein